MGTNLRALSRLLVADALVVISVSQSGNDVTLTGAVYDAVGATALATERAVVDAAGPTLYRDSGALADRLIAAAAGDAAVAAGGSGGGGIDDGDGTGSGFGLSTGAGVGGARAGGGASAGSSGGATAGSADAPGGGTTPSTSGGSATPEAVPVIALAPRDGPTAGQIAGWTMVGVGGVGVIVGTVLAVLAKNTHADYRVTSQASVDLPTLRDDGKALALGADLGLFLGAGIGLGGAAVLLFASGSSDTPEELLQTALLPAFVPIDGGGAVVVRGSLP
jgi:hypothetical protein